MASVRNAYLGHHHEEEAERLEDEGAALHSVEAYPARFDALILRSGAEGTLVVRDYKACSPRGVCLESAAATYAVARASLTGWSDEYGANLTEVVVEYDFLGRCGLEGRTVLRRDDLRMVWTELKTRAAYIYGRGVVAARRGEHCAWCPCRATCDGLSSAADVDGADPFDA